MKTIGIQLMAELGGVQMVLSGDVEASEAGINEAADRLAKALDRQRAKLILKETLVDYLAASKALELLPDQERDMLKARALDRVRIHEGMQAQHAMGGRRAEFKPSAQQRQILDNFDRETEAKRAEMARNRDTAKDSLPQLEAKILRLRERIAGADVIDSLEDEKRALDAPLAEAAD